jgi:uncharacterized membrane protein
MFLRRLLYKMRKKRARTIRHTFSFASVAVAALLAAVLLTQETSYIRLETNKSDISAGDRFTVDVFVGAQDSVNAIDIKIAYPENRVKVLGIDTGESVISIWTEDPRVENGQILLSGGTFRRGFVGDHLIARVNFEALTDGRAEFSVANQTLLAGDGSGSTVDNVDNSSVAVVSIGESGVIAEDLVLSFITDIDGDGSVTLTDVETFVSAWRAGNWVYDFNSDRKMNFTDFAIILADSFFR